MKRQFGWPGWVDSDLLLGAPVKHSDFQVPPTCSLRWHWHSPRWWGRGGLLHHRPRHDRVLPQVRRVLPGHWRPAGELTVLRGFWIQCLTGLGISLNGSTYSVCVCVLEMMKKPLNYAVHIACVLEVLRDGGGGGLKEIRSVYSMTHHQDRVTRLGLPWSVKTFLLCVCVCVGGDEKTTELSTLVCLAIAFHCSFRFCVGLLSTLLFL